MMTTCEPLKLLIADDHKLVRAGLAALLKQDTSLSIIGEAANGQQAVELWLRFRPDVTLMDLSMPVVEGLEAIRQIREIDPCAIIIALTTYDGDEDIYQALKVGAKGYLPKDTDPTELLLAIKTAWGGKTYLPPNIASKLMERLNSDSLTERELEIVQLIVRGLSNKLIAKHLLITEGTVKTHVKGVLAKLDATSRTEVVAIALRRGIAHLSS